VDRATHVAGRCGRDRRSECKGVGEVGRLVAWLEATGRRVVWVEATRPHVAQSKAKEPCMTQKRSLDRW
jgi:hypothetical protein